ncbi:hypothetical protein BROUX41_002607 [Berkeleyomyces rouxiae]|uniref:uncharacterized protein n=1 Tax=Berkeleyomyces rouxiae TaxID=2035830 RepID=UPI003B7CAEC9
MWYHLFSPWLLIATLFCAHTMGAQVRTVSQLGITLHEESNNWVQAYGPGGFECEARFDSSDSTITVFNVDNTKGNIFKAREGLLAIWEKQTGTSAGNFRHIRYNKISEDATERILNTIWDAYGHNVDDEDYISERTVYRPGNDEENWVWDYLRDKTPFGSGAGSICIDFEETNNLYISS